MSREAVLTALTRTLTACLLLAAVVILIGLLGGGLDLTGGRVLVTLAVTALVSSLLWVDLAAPATPRTRRLGMAGAAATLGAAALSYLFTWSPMVTSGLWWRGWWILSTMSVASAHLLLILCARVTPFLGVVRTIALGGVLVCSAMLVGMALRADVFAMPGAILSACLYAAGGAAALASGILLVWGRSQQVRIPWTAFRLARWTAFPVALFAAGFYLGRLTAPPPGVLDPAAGFLASLPAEAVESHVRADLERLRSIVQEIERLRSRAEAMRERVKARMDSDGRRVYLPREDDEIRSIFFSFLTLRTALLRMVAHYQSFDSLRDPDAKARCFLLGYCAGAVCYASSLGLIAAYRQDPLARAKLNEPEPVWGIPAGMFDRIHESVALEKHRQVFAEMTAYFQTHRERWRSCGLPAQETAWVLETIEHAAASAAASPLYGKGLPVSLLLDRVMDDAYTPVYAVQSLVSTWMGDTRLVSRPSCITQEQVEEMRKLLQPGDIILERRNWFLSNAFLPGFWPHAALYVGGLEDLKRLGIAGEPAVKDRLERFTARAPDGEPRCVIESISDGVSFSSLGEATRADYIAVLRPRVSEAEKAQAVLRAFTHQGKPYDFEFDFFSSDKLVCTELVYRAYEGILHFELLKIMGRMTLPAVEIARKYAREKDLPARELDFVLFLDSLPGGEQAVHRDSAEFAASAERPRAFNE